MPKYMHKCCVKCPLYEKLGFECGKGAIEDGDGWGYYMEEGDPELMLKKFKDRYLMGIKNEGLPEGYEIEKVIIKVIKCHALMAAYASFCYVKRNSRAGCFGELHYKYDCEINGAYWRIVEDSGENDDWSLV